MQVAKLELCKELYELSGWGKTDDGTAFEYIIPLHRPDDSYIRHTRMALDYRASTQVERIPAYDLGYLLRKLPVTSYIATRRDGKVTASTGSYKSGYNPFPLRETADTPENAACKLAIELFKQGILKKD